MERKTFPPFSVAASFDGEAPLLYRADQIRRQAINLATRQEYSGGLGHLKDLFTIVEEANESTRAELIGIVEDAFGSFTSIAFTRPFRGRTARRRVCTGIEALTILLSSGYDVSQDRLLAALRALSAAISTEPDYARANGLVVQLTDMVFRLLQRLLTGVGVRNGSSKRQILTEKDFNSVLNAFASVGRMDAAHKVVALQERTPGAPQLSPVTYSILLKGYGRLGDTENVEMTLQKARLNNIIPDTVMLNSVMDALINCHEVTKAEDIFLETVMKNTTVTPNLRTYNTMLKGYALKGELGKAQQLANLMEAMSFWDSVTTNTLVTVAVMVEDFAYAEAILSNHTSLSDITEINKKRKSDHPNVEAYTALLDGYAKAGFLDKALGVLQTMQKIGVLANEYTYTCMIAALVKKNKFLQAMKLLEYMESRGTMPTSVTYNAFLSSLAHVGRLRQASEDNGNDSNNKTNPRVVERALALLRRMVKSGVSPTVTTVSILLECFSTCSKPRVAEANAIVERFETDGTIPRNNIQVSTALIKVHGVAKDVKGALEIFRRIWRPDVIAVNAFLDAACRSGEVQVAFDTFGALFGGDSPSPRTLSPDVITYSILISSLVKINNVRAANKAQDLYKEMRSRKIFPDRPLVDM
jgi:pentatricopeptide repeat protein